MGKKVKKKGRGIEKTAVKTEKKITAKQKKHLAEIGEEDIEKILAQIEEEEKKKIQIKEITIDKPARRANFSFIAHPLKDELLLFGGEFFNGQKVINKLRIIIKKPNLLTAVLEYICKSNFSFMLKRSKAHPLLIHDFNSLKLPFAQVDLSQKQATVVYNDIISYNINKNVWTIIQAPNSPPPRCGHQMIALPKERGQLWIFGGEFTSSTQSQFYHYKDLWAFHLGEKRWEKITSPGGPSARSGHRMVHVKNQIIVFGGYHDNLRDYKYFNDVYAFDLNTYKWNKLEPSGMPPTPRSGCQMVPLSDGKILISGGYSKEKVKRDVDMGIIHTDMFLLSPEKNDASGMKWKWVSVKQGGLTPSPRSGSSIVLGPGNKAYSFGGVFDEEESEEDISGTFFNDLNILDLDKRTWRPVVLHGRKDPNQVKKRRKDKSEEGKEMDEDEAEVEEVVKVTDGVFTLKVSSSNLCAGIESSEDTSEKCKMFSPSPRMNCGLAVKNGSLYLYGGLLEEGDKQFTLADMYSLDLHKLDEWHIILRDDEATREWISSESESEEESNQSVEEVEGSDEEEMDVD